MNKPQTEGRVNHVCTEEHRRSSTLFSKKHNDSLSKVMFIIIMIELIIKDQQKTHRLINEIIYIVCLTYLIIAGLRHILSLYFTVLIHFDEY